MPDNPVEFTVTVEDNVDENVQVNCTPASASGFEVGTTTVNCTAEDAPGNEATGSFTVTIVDTTPPAVTVLPISRPRRPEPTAHPPSSRSLRPT
ncbi:MAG: HYR domain-containing protein [bacterium]